MRFSTVALLVSGLVLVSVVDSRQITAGDAQPVAVAAAPVAAPPALQRLRQRSVVVEVATAEPACGPNGCRIVTGRLVGSGPILEGRRSRGGLLSRMFSRRNVSVSRTRSLGLSR